MVVVGHATRPQLHLTRAQARRLISGQVARWHGLPSGSRPVDPTGHRRSRTPPRTLAVVPLRSSGTDGCRGPGDRSRPNPGPGRTPCDWLVVGDVMLTRGVPDAAAALAPMARFLRQADLTVGNLESTLSTRGTPTQGSDSFGGGPDLIPPLRRAGFDAVSLGNNHAGDYGETALLDSVRALADSSIEPFGAGENTASASRPAVVERGGVRFGFVGFNAIGETPDGGTGGPRRAHPPDAAEDRTTGAVGHGPRASRCTMNRPPGRRRRGAPALGTQYTHRPEPVQRRVGRALARAGADLVVGGHPHWVQGVDVVGDVPLLHSLGNFVFDMDFMEQTMEGVVLRRRSGASGSGRSDCCRTGWTTGASRRAGSQVQRPRGSSTTCGRPARGRSPPGDTDRPDGSAPTEPGHHRPRRAHQLFVADHGRHVCRGVVSGVRRAAQTRTGEPGAHERPVVAGPVPGLGNDRDIRPPGRSQQLRAHRIRPTGAADRKHLTDTDPVQRDHPAEAPRRSAGREAGRRMRGSRNGVRRRRARGFPRTRRRPGPRAAASLRRRPPRPWQAGRRSRMRCPRRRAPAAPCPGGRQRRATASPGRASPRLATTFTERPPGTGTPQDTPAGVGKDWRRTCQPSAERRRSTQSAARWKAGDVPGRGPT